MSFEIGVPCDAPRCLQCVHDLCPSCRRYQAGLAVGPPRLLKPQKRDEIPLSMRELVIWLNAKGFETKACKPSPPVVQITTRPAALVRHTDYLISYLEAKGIQDPESNIVASYDPRIPIGEILVVGLDSSSFDR